MKLHAYRINEQMYLEPVSADGIDVTATAEGDPLWLNIEAATPDEIAALLAPLGLHPLVLEGCLEPGDRLRVELIEEELFFSYPIGIEGSTAETPYVRNVCRRDLLVTIRDQPRPDELADTLGRARVRLLARSVAAIALYLVGINKDNDMRAALTLRDDVHRLGDRIEDDLESVDGGDIRALRQRTSALALMFEDQAASLSTLRTLGRDVLALEGLAEYFGSLDAELTYLARKMEQLDRQLQDARDQYRGALQDKANRRLNVLTIVQAIFVPLTLIAGIYGMNFAVMPELAWPNAYFACLALMGVVATTELWMFYRRGWFE